MRVLLTSVGSAGDIHPFIAVGMALRARGHGVVFAANPYFRDRIERAGLEFEPLGEFMDPADIARSHPAAFRRFSGARTLFREVFGPLMGELVAGMRRAADRAEPDVMVGHQISFGGPWVARRAGVPWFTTVLAPSTLLSNEDPSVYPFGLDVRGAPMWLRRLQHWAARKTVNGMLDPLLHDQRAAEGLPPRGDTLFGEMLEGRVLGLFSPSFRGPARDDPPGMTICGFPWFDRGDVGAPLTPELEAFLAEGAAPVVIALGSVLSQTEAEVLRRVVRAVRGRGHRVVLVGRDGGEHETHDTAMVRVGYAPFGALFPRAAAVVHHGGIGTTAQTARAGVPALVLAFAHDQFDNAARVERLGVGARGTSRTGERAIADSVDRIVGDGAMRARCRALAERIGNEDGADRAALEIVGQ